ncbi:hypothetical protein M9H77_35998 [Catharanthus roseus]|uniref:Uncharacterized protein n=1 Tax=Catharanthus roseus TaxID=4058 RepID=A0ACB9ZRD2_CATRO|nr:hypothetical protein M9H77_35998 [Catharanthus roseus]
MGAKSKQEDYQSKLTRDMHIFYHGGGNGFNAYGGNNHRNGNFTSRTHVGAGNFSSYAKSFEHTSYDDYGDHALRFGEVKRMEYFQYIHFKNHDAIANIHKTFEKKRLVLDHGDWH